MPQLQNLVLKDRAATPKSHTFTPRNVEQNVGTVVETTGVPVGEPRFSISLRQTADNYKAELRLMVPVVQDQIINNVSSPVAVRQAIASATFTFAKTSTEAERNDIVGMFADALAVDKTLVNDCVVKLGGIYG